MPGCPLVACHPPRRLPSSAHSHAFQARWPASPLTLLCVSMFLVSLFFFKQRNVSLKGSRLPSGTLAPGHPLRSPECARESQGPLPLCGPRPVAPQSWSPQGAQVRKPPSAERQTLGVAIGGLGVSPAIGSPPRAVSAGFQGSDPESQPQVSPLLPVDLEQTI